MRRESRATRWLPLAAAVMIGIVLGAVGQRVVAAAPAFSETPLLRTDLAGVAAPELIVSRLDTAPGWSHGRHHHAGHEVVYVLEGTGALAVDGKPERRLEPGTLTHVPPGQVHAGRNAGGTAFKFLLIRVHPRGAPLSVELN